MACLNFTAQLLNFSSLVMATCKLLVKGIMPSSLTSNIHSFSSTDMWRKMLKSVSVLVHIHNHSERLDVFDMSGGVRPETLQTLVANSGCLSSYCLPMVSNQSAHSDLWPSSTRYFPDAYGYFHFFFQIILCKPWTLLWSESPAAQLETQQPPSPCSKSLGTPSISSFCLLNADWLFKQLKIELCKLAGASISVWANNVSWTGKKTSEITSKSIIFSYHKPGRFWQD